MRDPITNTDAVLADVWDAAISEALGYGWLNDYSAMDMRERNPHRAQHRPIA